MQNPALVFLVLFISLQISTGSSKEEATNIVKDSTAPRARRSSNDYMRYGRALYMLRLGKRGFDSPVYLANDDDDSDGRLRRSLSSTDEQVLSIPQLQTKELSKNMAGDLEDAKDSELPWNLPHEPAAIFKTLDEEAPSGDDLDGLALGKRQLQMLRLGKRSLSMLRLGKRDFEDEEEKRSLNMLRLGKRQLQMLRLGKRSLGMLRLGKSLQDEDIENDKRSLNMLRLGKRQLAMLRLGKRGLAMLRLGKRFNSALDDDSELSTEKRPISMLRLGKREEEDKRSLKMLRLGKRSA